MGLLDVFKREKKDTGQITEHFHASEFRSQWDDVPYPREKYDTLKTLCEQLEVIRAHIGKPLTITSGYRTPENNKRVQGMAADINVKGMSGTKIGLIILELIKSGEILQGGVGMYKTFCHYDIRGKAARWKG